MENNQLLPFERNRYYVGKLLTSADFQAEQTYGSHKRRFLNGMMFGSGIVCGLGVYSLDDLSIMIDSGVAMDGYGRDVVLDNSVVKKLSAIDGFEGLSTDRATLCLVYREEPVHPVYAVRAQADGETYEHNRIREGWDLVLRDSDAMPPDLTPDPEFLSSAVLYEDSDYAVSCAMPGQSACGSAVRLDVTVRRYNKEAAPLTVRAAIHTPAFLTEGRGHELVVEMKDLDVAEEATFSYWLTAQDRPAPDCVLMAETAGIVVHVGEQRRVAGEGFSLRAAVVDQTPDQIVDRAATSASLELRQMGGSPLIPLAEITMQRTRNAYLIEKVEGAGVRRYVRTAAADGLRRELAGWFKPAAAPALTPSEGETVTRTREPSREPVYATGVCEIPLSANGKRGQVAYSDEIVHGLGTRNVFVTVGTEYLAEDAKIGTIARNTIYGRTALFPTEQTSAPSVDTAVKVMNDRGSFVVAAQLLEDTAQVLLKLRWVAVAMPGNPEEDKVNKLAGKSITAVQPTVVLATRESHYFNVRFRNMEPCTLTYELTEKDSGEITSDGIYTAPGREGVFEIRISCAEMPLLSTYAYAVVKKRDPGQEEEQ